MTAGYEPRFDLDLAYGESSERYVADLLRLRAATVEVKHKRRPDEWLYVETYQNPRAAGEWKRSGIHTTEAKAWAYHVADTGAVLIVPARVLFEAAKDGRPREERDGDNPTRGRLVNFAGLQRAAQRLTALIEW